MKTENFVLNGMMGLVVGVALGVPVEFMIREELKADPVIDMRNYEHMNSPKVLGQMIAVWQLQLWIVCAKALTMRI